MDAHDDVLALVLAAGRGLRLGQPKALMDLGGEPALARVLATLGAAGLTRLTVVLGPDAAAVRAAVDLSGATVRENPEPERGMSASLRVGLAGRAPPTSVLLHTVDHPLVGAADVARLLAARDVAPEGTAVIAPSVGRRRGHPTWFAPVAAAELAALADDQPPHVVVRRDPGRVHHVELDDPWIVRDIDLPTDLADAQAEWTRRAAAG